MISKNKPAKELAYLIQAENISHLFEDKEVLSNISLTIKPKEIVTLIGPNGAGKSTLLKILLSLTKPSKGIVRRKKGLRIGFMPQKVHIDSSLPLTVEGFLKLANTESFPKKILRKYFGSADNLNASVSEILTLLGIEKLRGSQLKNLSGGEFQRALLARAIITKPHLLVLDEPVQGVDLQGQTELYHLIDQIKDKLGCGILMVSHDLHFVMKSTNAVLCLNQHLCCSGHPRAISEHPNFQNLYGNDFKELAVYEHHHDHSQCDHTHGTQP